jgi:hypothetical protein
MKIIERKTHFPHPRRYTHLNFFSPPKYQLVPSIKDDIRSTSRPISISSPHFIFLIVYDQKPSAILEGAKEQKEKNLTIFIQTHTEKKSIIFQQFLIPLDPVFVVSLGENREEEGRKKCEKAGAKGAENIGKFSIFAFASIHFVTCQRQ